MKRPNYEEWLCHSFDPNTWKSVLKSWGGVMCAIHGAWNTRMYNSDLRYQSSGLSLSWRRCFRFHAWEDRAFTRNTECWIMRFCYPKCSSRVPLSEPEKKRVFLADVIQDEVRERHKPSYDIILPSVWSARECRAKIRNRLLLSSWKPNFGYLLNCASNATDWWIDRYGDKRVVQ